MKVRLYKIVTVSGFPTTEAVEGEVYAAWTPIAVGGQQPCTFICTGLPIGVTCNTVTGRISGTPAVASAGLYNCSLVATDVRGRSSLPLLFSIDVSDDGTTPGPIIADQDINFGALTLANAGRLNLNDINTGTSITSVTITGGTKGAGWEIVDSFYLRRTQAMNADQDNLTIILTATNAFNSDVGVILTLNVEANTFHIEPNATMSELVSALAASGSGGKTIKGRPGIGGQNRPSITGYGSGGSRPLYTSDVVITSDNLANKMHIEAFAFVGCSHLKLIGLQGGRGRGVSNKSTSLWDFSTTATWPTNSHNKVTECILESSPLDGTNQQAMLRFSDGTDMVCTLNEFGGSHLAINTLNCDGVIVAGNNFERMAGDTARIGANNTAAVTRCNDITIAFNRGGDYADDNDVSTHHDFIQTGSSSGSGDYTGLRYIGNVMDIMGSDAAVISVQQLFSDDFYKFAADHQVEPVWVGNVGRTTSSYGILMMTCLRGRAYNNTCLYPRDGLSGASEHDVIIQSEGIEMNTSLNPDAPYPWAPIMSEDNVARWNCANGFTEQVFSTGFIDADNVTLTRLDAGEYNAALNAPINADVMVAFALKAAGPLDTTPIKKGAIGTPYINFTTRIVDHPALNTYTAFDFVDKTGQATNTVITSAPKQVTGITEYYHFNALGTPSEAAASNGVLAEVSGAGTPQLRVTSDLAGTTVITDWTTGGVIVANNHYLWVRLTSSASAATARVATVKVGDIDITWSVTTS